MNISTTILLHAVPGFIILSVVEILFLKKEYSDKVISNEFKISSALGIGFLTISYLTKGFVILCFSFIYQYRFFTLPAYGWWLWIFFLVIEDFTFYWFHRLSHNVRFFWASHQLHHSSKIYSLASTFRETWTGTVTCTFLFWGWMPLIGVEPGVIVLLKSFSMIYQFWLHTESIKRLPRWFEWIFNTPSHHRVHHGSNEEYLDKNFGGILIIWDRMFGTYLPETIRPKYGLTKDISSNNIFIIALHEWFSMYKDFKKANTRSEKWNMLFNKPGWKYGEKHSSSNQ
jgi:sterol desaturase/sphingolipid hydroxylase (fatty acid hydroxylase superfamily)